MQPPSLTITADTPLWRSGSNPWEITQQNRDYEHTVEAVGGYWSARFTIRGGRSLIDDWLQDGLGRHVEVFDHSLTKIWEGFVNRVDANYGPLAATRGPLLDIANRVWVSYSSIEYDEDNNPIVGTREETTRNNDTDSQALWGIVPKLLSSGGLEYGQAEVIRDTYAANHALPRTSKRFRSDSKADTSVTVDCLGYVRWMNWVYALTTGGNMDASAKIIDVLGDTPNVAWLAFDTTHVDSNPLQVPAWEDESKLAWSVIKDTVVRGDASYNRWLFGIYNNLEAWYHAAPTTVEYQQRLSQPKPTVEHIDGHEIYPWQVRPGKWLMFPDFLIGQAPSLDLREDPRAMFIESVTFRAPDVLDMRGGSVDTVDALVAQLGLLGVGA